MLGSLRMVLRGKIYSFGVALVAALALVLPGTEQVIGAPLGAAGASRKTAAQ